MQYLTFATKIIKRAHKAPSLYKRRARNRPRRDKQCTQCKRGTKLHAALKLAVSSIGAVSSDTFLACATPRPARPYQKPQLTHNAQRFPVSLSTFSFHRVRAAPSRVTSSVEPRAARPPFCITGVNSPVLSTSTDQIEPQA